MREKLRSFSVPVQRRLLLLVPLLAAFVAVTAGDAFGGHLDGKGSVRHSDRYQRKRYEIEIEYEDRNARYLQKQRIATEEESRREAERQIRRDEIQQIREFQEAGYLETQELQRAESRAASRAPRGYYYRRPGSEVSSLPAAHETLSVNGEEYFHYQGVFFRKIPSGFIAVTSPPGAIVPQVPEGYSAVTHGSTDYYYYFGTYYTEAPEGFLVTSPPSGTTVPYLPDGYATRRVEGSLHFAFGDILYRPYYRDGVLVYAVATP